MFDYVKYGLITKNEINIMYRIIKMGKVQLPLAMENEELKNLIDSFIAEYEQEFSYVQLCNGIKYYALQNNYFEKEAHVEYHYISITNEDHHRITKYLWQLIWEHKLIINFQESNGNIGERSFKFIKL